jgi:hypothetical protein
MHREKQKRIAWSARHAQKERCLLAKIGEGHAAAMARLGLKELRNAFNPSRESAADQEMGLYGTQTQGEIANARKGAGEGPEQEAMSMDKLRAEAEERAKANEQEKGGPAQERDRDQGRER